MESIIISVIVLAVAVVLQFMAFSKTQAYRHKLKQIFPISPEDDLTTELDDEGLSVQIKFQNTKKRSAVFTGIVEAINNYLKKNQGAADYSTLKDITDRQSDAVEAQIEATAPVPIYIGLCGTVLGIVLGVCVLAFGGGLDSLLTVSDSNETLPSVAATISQATENLDASKGDAGAEGIKMLLQGVGIAMLTTFIGVLLTIIGSWTHKNATGDNEDRKNKFLNWMQGELLPQMKHNMVSTLIILQKNLAKFNKDFASNSQELSKIFGNINTSYRENTKLLEAVQKLDVDAMAEANIRVLRELKACTDEINDLHSFLEKSNRYLASIETLNNNLSDHLDRTKLIENMARFFQDEIQQITYRKSAISKAVEDIDLEVQKSLEGLSKHTGQQYRALTDSTSKQHLEFMKAVEEQQKALNHKLEETSIIVDELKNLVGVKESLNKMVEVATVQNEKMDKLLAFEESIKSLISLTGKQGDKINTLAESVRCLVEKGIPVQYIEKDSLANAAKGSGKVKFPIWAIITCSVTCAVVVGTCVVFILKSFGVL